MIAIVFALEFEAATFIARFGTRLNAEVWVLGVAGARCAAVLEKRIAAKRPSAVISAGFGGGLRDDVAAGEIVISTNFSHPELLVVLPKEPAWRHGRFVTSPEILATAAEKRALGLSTGALVGDMETSHVAGVCSQLEIPLLAVRAVSDTSSEDLPVPSHVLINPVTGRPDPAALFRYLFTHPRDAVGFKRLMESAQLARRNLTSALDPLVSRLLRAPGAVASKNPCSRAVLPPDT